MPGNMPTVVVGRHARGHREDGHPETVSQTAGEILTLFHAQAISSLESPVTREDGLMECDRTHAFPDLPPQDLRSQNGAELELTLQNLDSLPKIKRDLHTRRA
ncbi:hypothetical protein CIHG_06485 [Coccidioides immitis H538.4]|uniref:Uncharacterized protein n=3 Tax=Coccidioides immitis TaxID=5501 RepID=A0A0J8QW88_COCIT|nr:hypothetical protein CIRG_10297 [Coccidioides immitis RMSCC 2394]KMU76741.1 hypothetical protein CISG_05884 [Coccidioides immitis RMSCC 3703]KMU88816.1 hypothetical protein CIHG_06485 [Coccidioides immitis H538.4]